jgi:hypothetical protein
MNTTNESKALDAQAAAASEQAPGAVPPTGGVPPEDAAANRGSARARSAADDLADGLDLLLRATRKAMHSVDPRLEAMAQRALGRLQQFDSEASTAWHERTGIDPKQVEKLASDAGREIATVVERLATRVESVFGAAKK